MAFPAPLHSYERSITRFIRLLLALPAAILLIAASPDTVKRNADETSAQFAARILGQAENELQTLETTWNGRRAIFADYLTTQRVDQKYVVSKRKLVVLMQDDAANWHLATVADIDEEGGVAEIAAIGFANADRDAAQELIVLIKWPQIHYDYGGAFYDVQLYDTPKSGESALPYLAKTSEMFGGIACDCTYRDGRESTDAPYATIAAIKKKLASRGH